MKQKFNIEVTYRTVEVECQIIEAKTFEEALDTAREVAPELDWDGRSEVIDGEYLVEEA